jgi:hypothetical protein
MNYVMRGQYTMPILPIYYTTNNTRKRKARTPTQAMIESQRLTQELLNKVGYHKPTKSTKKFTYSLTCESNAAPLSNTIPGGIAAKRDIRTDHKWKRDHEEKPETIKAIEDKANRIAPAYNKGATQYITDGTEAKYLGRKI